VKCEVYSNLQQGNLNRESPVAAGSMSNTCLTHNTPPLSPQRVGFYRLDDISISSISLLFSVHAGRQVPFFSKVTLACPVHSVW
jgi:hypothetical protein